MICGDDARPSTRANMSWILLSVFLISCFAGSAVHCQETAANPPEIHTETSVHQTCNETIRDSWGYLLSPNYPNNYDPNTVCEYRLIVEQGRNVEITFRLMDVEVSGNCMNDKVELYNGLTTSQPKIGKYCGTFRPPVVVSTTNEMLLRFTSDGSREGYGFMATFASVIPLLAEPGSCGGLLLGEQGTFHSVNFPKSNYPNSMTCVWHIRAPMNREVVLRFNKFNIESSQDCTYDKVTVYGKEHGSGELEFLGKYCKLAQVPDELVAGGNQMYITFSTDSSGNDVGFGASYTTRPINLVSISRGVDEIERKLDSLLPTFPTRRPATTRRTTTTTTAPTTTTTTAPTTTTTTTTAPATTTTAPTTTTPTPTTTVLPTTTRRASRRTTTTATPDSTGCSSECPEPSTNACNNQFYAIYGRVGKVRKRPNRPLTVLIITQKVIKMPRSWAGLKRKSRINLVIDCPSCYPHFDTKSKVLLTGISSQTDPSTIVNPTSVGLYKKKEYKRLRKMSSACRRARRRKRNRNKRNHKKV